LSSSPGDSIPLVCQNWANTRGAYRFLDNDRVSEAEILAGHFHATRDRVRATSGPMLALHDTTGFSCKRDDIEAVGKTRINISPHLGDLCGDRRVTSSRVTTVPPWDRLLFNVGAFLVSPKRLPKIAIGIRPATLPRFHRALVRRRLGPKGPSKESNTAVLEMKHRNPRDRCPRIAQQIGHALGIEIGKLTDDLRSVDLLRCESIGVKSYCAMVVMDLFTRRIVGVSAEPAHIGGVAVRRMFSEAIARQALPKHLSSDNDRCSASIAGGRTCECSGLTTVRPA
jgi:hypothetical protein